jgi:holo-[acyl-carrier protein] synthase
VILGIGHDIVHIPRFASVLDKWGQRFLDRLFTAEEQRYCLAMHEPARHFAARFAAKEAFYKALSRGRQFSLGFLEAWVSHVVGVELRLVLSPKALTLAQQAGVGIGTVHLSLSHDGDYASAFVVLESAP